jgi:glucokinase
VAILGAEASNLALKVFATNGVYLAGGIPARIRPALEDGKFVEALTRKGRLSELLADIPIFLVLNPDVCLLGAAKLGFENSERRIGGSEKVTIVEKSQRYESVMYNDP